MPFIFHHSTLSLPKCKLGHGLELSSKLAAVCYILLHGFELLCEWASPFMVYIAGVSRGYQWFISVAGEVEGGYLGLAPLQLHHPLLGRQALVQLVHSHYVRAALPGLINMLGSSNVLGKLQQQQCSKSVSAKAAC